MKAKRATFKVTAAVTTASHRLLLGGQVFHAKNACLVMIRVVINSSTIQNATWGRWVRGPAAATSKSSRGEAVWPTNAKPPSGHSRIP